ncbi:MAG TPA: phosphatase PAP2 family protein [Anaerolineae bacterium]|nr:phosphatase PAP2 family protein [Anaerolineae bacterium]
MARSQHPRPSSGVTRFTSTPAILTMALAFFALALLVKKHPTLELDKKIARAAQAVHIPGYQPLMHFLSWTGYLPQVLFEVGVAILYLTLIKRKLEAALLTFSTLGMAFGGYAIKLWVNRPRPSPDLVRVTYPELDAGRLSFTAGHVQANVSVLGFLSFLIWLQEHKTMWQKALLGFFLTIIALGGPSRLYEGAHWFTDILGGYLWGLVWLMISIRLYLQALG